MDEFKTEVDFLDLLSNGVINIKETDLPAPDKRNLFCFYGKYCLDYAMRREYKGFNCEQCFFKGSKWVRGERMIGSREFDRFTEFSLPMFYE